MTGERRTLSAAIKSGGNGWLEPEDKVVLLNKGSVLKSPQTVAARPPLLGPEDRLPPLTPKKG